uniref:Uncharacterized protein n=1 Tax=Triticum urartu TaxID=4572 RepID=A0A8R7PC30_TRIUA
MAESGLVVRRSEIFAGCQCTEATSYLTHSKTEAEKEWNPSLSSTHTCRTLIQIRC